MSLFSCFLKIVPTAIYNHCVTDVHVPACANAEVPEVMEILIVAWTKHVSLCSKATLKKLMFNFWPYFFMYIMWADDETMIAITKCDTKS